MVTGHDSAVVEGQEVVLHRITPEGGAAIDSTITDAGGRFAFPLPDRPPDTDASAGRPVYLATARHGGVLYMGPAAHAGDPVDDYRIEVYPSERVASAPDLALRSRTLLLAPDGDGMRVVDAVVARGRPGRTLVGAPADGGPAGPPDTVPDGEGERGRARTAWWSVAVPAGATDVRVLPGAVDASEVSFVPGEARISAAVPPSGQRVVLGYRLAGGSPLELVLRHRVETVEVVAGRGAGPLRVPGGQEVEPLEVQGDRLTRYRLGERRPGDTVRVVAAGEAPSGRRTAGWIAVAAGVVLLGAAVWARRRRASPDTRAADRRGDGGS